MTRQATEQQIGRDLELIDMIEALGSKSAKRKARAQRKAIHAQIKAWNIEDGLVGMSNEDILAGLLA